MSRPAWSQPKKKLRRGTEYNQPTSTEGIIRDTLIMETNVEIELSLRLTENQCGVFLNEGKSEYKSVKNSCICV